LMYAAMWGNIDIAEMLILKKAQVNARDNLGMTPLIFALRGNHKDMIEYLISHGADVNVKDKLRRTALSYAKTEEIRKMLIEAGAKE